jgi:hypothetical protein
MPRPTSVFSGNSCMARKPIDFIQQYRRAVDLYGTSFERERRLWRMLELFVLDYRNQGTWMQSSADALLVSDLRRELVAIFEDWRKRYGA